MYPQIHWEPFADPLQSAHHPLGTNDLKGHERTLEGTVFFGP